MLDSTFDIATPEGVELKLPVAGLAPRALAWIIDSLIKYSALTIISVITQMIGEVGVGFLLLGAFLLLWFYNVVFEVLFNGATPGKKIVGLRVMNANGTPVGWSGSLLRNLLRFVDTLPSFYLFGCISVLLTRNFQRLGDLAADTIVVYAPRRSKPSTVQDVVPLPLRISLSADEQQALISFADRTGGINKERAEELAALLQPLLADASSEVLKAHASWLSGRRESS